MRNFSISLSCFFILLVILISSCHPSGSTLIANQDLRNGWELQSSSKVNSNGAQISSSGYKPEGWHPALVPGTVLGSLVADSTFKDIFLNDNLTRIPDTLFNVPWWYRTTFHLEKADSDQVVQLRFNGINYRADFWLNGQKIAASDTIEGGFRRFTFNISPFVKEGENVLAVEVTRPHPGELTVGFVDWNPEPPDHSMGIWRNVELLVSGPVSIDQPFVETRVDTATLKQAWLTVTSLLENHSDKPVKGTLQGTIGNNEISFSKEVELAPGASEQIIFRPEDYPQLSMDNPRLWWVHNWGEPYLYPLHLEFKMADRVSDTLRTHFGIRQVTNYFTRQGFRGFKLNGKKILIKGGGWVDKMLLDGTKDYEKASVDYAVHMNLNAMRMEGFWGEDQHLYDLFDKNGILLMAGFSCQWEWEEYLGTPDDEFSAILTPEQNNIAAKSWRDQIIWLRNHPSIFTWLYGSDKRPRPSLEKRYIDILKQYDTTRVAISSAADYTPGSSDSTMHISKLSGPSAMKMRGPYDYVPPSYWYTDTSHGGAFGFNTETSPGPEIVVKESLEKMVSPDSLWPINKAWLYHAARHNFYNFTYYNNAINHRLGTPAELNDYLRKAQFTNYEGMRAMFEAFTSNRPRATGIIQWMYNASWPKLWWQLYDYYLMPTGAFYGAKKANEPYHISYNYGKNTVEVINNTLDNQSNLKALVKVVDFNMKEVLSKEITLPDLRDRETKTIFQLPEDLPLTKTWFLFLQLSNSDKSILSHNFYALSTQKDELNEKATTWFTTPQSRFADMSLLQNLDTVALEKKETINRENDSTKFSVKLRNPSSHLAFMVHLDLKEGQNGASVVPVFWEDNYISLLPGEEREIKGYCHTKDLEGRDPFILIDGWNIK